MIEFDLKKPQLKQYGGKGCKEEWKLLGCEQMGKGPER